MQCRQVKLSDCRLGQCDMGIVRRVECAAEDADPPGIGGGQRPQTQSRLTRKSLQRRSSADPSSSSRWYDQLANGGMDIKIDSVRPPD